MRETTPAAVDAVRDISSSINGLDESAGTIDVATSEIGRNITVTAGQTTRDHAGSRRSRSR